MFRYRNKVIEKLDRVSYLGMEMNADVNLDIIANTLSDAASRALGALTAKYYQTKGMTFQVYQTIYNTCVTPIMDYTSEVSGYKTYTKLEIVQHKAINGYLGIGKTCPTPVIVVPNTY